MMIFPFSREPLVVAEIGERKGVTWWRLVKPLVFSDAAGVTIQVRMGFETDFASVPRFLWSVFPPAGKYSRAAVIHDWLYRETVVSRFLADAIFREAMAQLGVPLWKRVLMFYAVRAFGWTCRAKVQH